MYQLHVYLSMAMVIEGTQVIEVIKVIDTTRPHPLMCHVNPLYVTLMLSH